VRRRTRLIVVVVLLAWIVAAGVLLADAARHLVSGRDTASETVDGIQPSALLSSDVAGPLEDAAADFETAHDRLSNPVLTPIRLLPVLGRQLRSVDASADSAGEAVQLAASALRRTRATVTKPIADGPARLAVIDELSSAVEAARAGMAELDLGPDKALIGPVRTVHRDLAERVDDARDALARADEGLTATRKLLAGPSRYLVVAANNAEMRAGSGMWLTGGLLTAENGRLQLGEMEQLYRVARPPDGAVNVAEVDADLQDNWGWMRPDVEWRSLMASPRFVPSAEVAARMWAASGHEPVDGVLVLDAVGLGNLVAATGPVTLDGRTYDRDGIIRELLHDQYVRFQSSFQSDRREALSDVADAVFDRIDAGSWKADELARRLTDSVRGRHLLLWAADPTSQRAWAAAGASGTLQTDSLAVSLLNRGGNKLDWFLRSTAALSSERDGDDRVVTLELSYTNTVGEGEPSYISGPWPEAGTVKDEYKGVVAVNLPGFARDITLDGVPIEIRGDDGPTKVMAGTLRLKRGERATVTVRFRIAGGDTFVVAASARHPATPWTFGSTTWRDDRARTVRF
jgi:hypothetical protein